MTIRSWRITLPLVFFIAQLVQSCTTVAQVRNVSQYEDSTIRKVYNDLVRAINDPDRPPELFLLPGKKLGAQLIQGHERIEVDAHLMDMCRKFEKDSLNALALLLGHELAHFYMRHESGGVSISPAKKRKRDEITNRKVKGVESEADYFSGFYGRMAGYDPLRVATEVLQRFYDTYDLSDPLDGYPPLAERKSIAIDVDKRLNKLIPVFEIANNLTLVRNFNYAQRCYDHIINEFPSRELLNNAGTAYALEALQRLDSRYLYPLDLDMDTRLRGIDRGTRSPTREDTLEGRRLLDSARIRFERAMKCDSAYSSAIINLATVHILQEHPEKAIDLVEGNINSPTNERTEIMARTVIALAHAAMRQSKQAKKELKEVQKRAEKVGIGELVQGNIDVMNGKRSSGPLKLGLSSGDEAIYGMKATEYALAEPADITEPIGNGNLRVHRRTHLKCSITLVRHGEFWLHFISTMDGYTNTSHGGIKIGSTDEEVRQAYGDDPRIINTPQGRYYIYDYSKIMFLLSHEGQVLRWTIYATK